MAVPLDALNAYEDVVRVAVQVMLQELIEADATAATGAGCMSAPTPDCYTDNGHRPRTLSVKTGDLGSVILTLSSGPFLLNLWGGATHRPGVDRGRDGREFDWAWVSKTERIIRAPEDTGICKSEVSEVCVDFDTEVAFVADLDLSEVEFPYVFIDVSYFKARIDGVIPHREASLGAVVFGLYVVLVEF